MVLLKDLVRQFYPLLIMCACMSFVVYVFFWADYNGGIGIFENTGSIYSPLLEEGDLKHAGLKHIEEEVQSDVPIIKYNSACKQVGDCVLFKELFFAENDGVFELYLTDIKAQSGKSVLEEMSSEEIADMEEVPAAFVYDKEQDILHIYGSGVYTVEVKVYGSNGATKQYEFTLPVETS